MSGPTYPAHDTIFTWAAPPLRIGLGAVEEVGFELSRLGAHRVLLVTDLQLVDGVRGLISLFSARQAPEPGKLPAALFPNELPEGAAYDKFVETVTS